ncbi:aminoglycoside phosphotransferase family protein [Actinospongicola halichondriae]|uniref:aminoglycoside phosphotransferase family protein n=1 Tax=Actinospongicola halichondriae TaxID=3236844 RepID=UPI003D513928
MRASGGTRIEWDEIPSDVRAAIGGLSGSRIETADNQAGGFSPGLAARCRLADGRRVFVKAVSPDQNPQACRIHRREAEIAMVLPPSVPAPRLIGVHDDGRWVALVFDDVDGRQPSEPWTADDLDLVIPALQEFSASVTPSPVATLQSVGDRHRPVFSGWRRLAGGDGDPGELPSWARTHVDHLAELESGWEDAAAGSTLLHADLRADNLLLADGRVWIVDWPWACQGAAFVDLVFLLPSIGLGGGPDPATVTAQHHLFSDVEPDALAAVVAALSGFFLRSSMDPPPPGLPTLRAFQRAQGDVALRWAETLAPGI